MHGSVLLIRLLPFFLHHMGETRTGYWRRFLGYYARACACDSCAIFADGLNPDSLKVAASRVGNTKIRATLQHDVFDFCTFPADTGASIPFRCTIFCALR